MSGVGAQRVPLFFVLETPMMTVPSNTSEAAPARPGTVERARMRLLEGVIEPVLDALGYELVYVEWAGSGKRRKLVVFVDRPPTETAETVEGEAKASAQPRSGIGLDDCARLSPIISNALDAAEAADEAEASHGGAVQALLSAPYVLEVSSPGLERPLCRRSHFERFLGRRIKLRVYSPLTPGDTQRNFHGRIEQTNADPDHPNDDREGIVCLRDPDDGRQHRIPLHRVRRAHLVYEG